MRVVFLDFDGVISTNRAWIAQKDQEDFYLRWLDPIACAMLRELIVRFDLKIVVSSTWRNFGHDHVVQCLEAHGLDVFLHDDWRTKDLWRKGVDSKAARPLELEEWLSRNPVSDYIILDDDGFDWTDEQITRWIKTDTLDGLGVRNFEEVENYFELYSR